MKRGMTMVELLIVVAVMVILMGITLPAMKTGIESSRLKAAADIVKSQLVTAQSLAVEHDCETAVVLRARGSAVQKVEVLVESQRYAGDLTDSRAFVSRTGPTGLQVRILDGMAPSVVEVGDRIRFDHHWHQYRIVAKQVIVTPTGPQTLCNLDGTPGLPPVATTGSWWPFVVQRRPQPSGHGGIQLPGVSCVDLSGSGYGMTDDQWGTGATVAQDVMIGFSPRGQIAWVRIGATERIPTDPIWLLVGEVDAAGLRPGTVAANVENPNSRWVRLDSHGQVSVVPNGWSVGRPTLSDSRGL